MKVTLIQIDKTDEQWLNEGISKYEKRLIHYVNFDIQTISIGKNIRSKSIEEQKREEGKQLIKVVEKYDLIILLDEQGKSFTSEKFSNYIEKLGNEGRKSIAFIIGGPFGFSEEMYRLAHQKIRLSDMTFSHQMVRLFFTEQLYRAYTIIKREKYHHS